MQITSRQSASAICYTQAPYVSGFMAQQEFNRVFGVPAHGRAITNDRKLPLIYTLAGLTVYCSVFWVAVFRIIF